VDHLFVFEGDGLIKDFPGNYTQYKLWSDERKKKEQLHKRITVRQAEAQKPVAPVTNKLSFKEKRELESLENEIAQLEAEKADIEMNLQSGVLSPDALKQNSERWAAILPEIEVKTDRWMELSDRVY
jgi:ATP-binding cassette subfamily F protein uup